MGVCVVGADVTAARASVDVPVKPEPPSKCPPFHAVFLLAFDFVLPPDRRSVYHIPPHNATWRGGCGKIKAGGDT